MFICRATVKVRDVEEKKLQFTRAEFTFARELSPEEADSPDLKMDETVLVFGHPLS